MKKKNESVAVVEIQNEVTRQLATPAVVETLVQSVFVGFSPVLLKQAVTEGMMRGFSFKDFLEKNVYAIKYGNGYTLITSIDYSRKIGAKSGVVGKSAPTYTYNKDGIVESCTITIKKMIGNHIGEFTETVFFSEYTTGKNQWLSKPRTMIAKVAEMHALRMACPEELSQAYVEEEMSQEVEKPEVVIPEVSEEDIILATEKLESAVDLTELAKFWANLPIAVKEKLKVVKEELKAKLTPKNENTDVQN